MDFMDEDFFKEKEFVLNDFISKLGKMGIFDILDKISTLKFEDRKKVLACDEIKKVLGEGLLLESASNQWYFYREILKRITPFEFLSLYNVDMLKQLFSSYKYGNISVFFAALCEKNINSTVEYLLNDNEMFNEFLKQSDYFCSLFSELDYDLFKKIVFKLQENNEEISYDFLSVIKEEYQYKIYTNNS